MEDFTPDLITVVDDDNTEHEFEILDRIETDDDKKYVALTPVFNDAEELLNDSGELIILRVIEEDEGNILEPIEDEAEYEEIGNIFMERLSEYYDFEGEE